MQTVCIGRSRLEGFWGSFFLVTAGILVTGPQRHGGSGASQDITALLKASQASWRRSASPLSSVLVTRAILVTALVTDLVTRFSPNSYVFL